jgi:flagellar hook-associated protein 3 FlgL
MSGTISGLSSGSGFGLLQQLIANSTATKTKLDQLTEQASSGYVSTTYSGLSPAAASTSLSLAPRIAGIATTVSNLNAVTARMGIQQNALSSISQIATNFMGQLDTVNSINPSSMATVAASAKQALTQVAGLLNTQYGGIYVFAGQDSGNPPVPNANNISSSGFYTQIGAAVSGLASNGAAATSASTLTIASSDAAGTTPFSSGVTASSTPPVAEDGAGNTVAIGITANANAFVASTGSDTTGSYMRDIMRGLATIANLQPSQVGSSAFTAFAQSTSASLQNAVSALNQDAGVLGNTQSALSTQSTALQQSSAALSTQLAGADQVDMATTLSNLSATQTQLQASYQLIAAMKTMSLTQYL